MEVELTNDSPGKEISLGGNLNFSEKWFGGGPGIWSDDPLVLSDDNELEDEARESLWNEKQNTQVSNSTVS